MKTTLEDISSVKKKLVIEVEAKEVDKKLNETYKSIGKTAKIRGFRPGKVPRKVLENHYGSQVLEDVTNSLVRETLPKGMEEKETFPLDMPIIENEILKQGEDFKYSALMEVKPEFELKDYKGIEVEKEIFSVTEEDVNKQLEGIREGSGTLVSVDDGQGIEDGNYAIIDYECFDNGSSVEGVKSENFTLRIGKQEFYPGVEDAIKGLKKGDETDVKVNLDDDYFDARLAGKSVDFKIKIVDVKEMELPELDNKLASSFGEEFKTVDDIRKRLEEDLVKREEARVDKELKERIIKKISETVDFELPECLVKNEIDTAIETVKQNLMRAGSSFDKSGMDEASLREKFRPVSEDMVKGMLILGEIAKQCELTVNEEDENEGFEKMAASMGQNADVMRKYHEANNMMDSFRQTLLKEKTLNFLVENARVTKTAADKIQGKD